MADETKTPGMIAREAFENNDAISRLQVGTLAELEQDDWESAAEAVRAPLLKRIAELEAALIPCQQCSTIAGQPICHGGNECKPLTTSDIFGD